MSKKDWSKVAQKQFTSLDKEIQDDWKDLFEMTAHR